MGVGARPLYPRERIGTYFIGGWVGLRASLGGCGKSCPSPGFSPRTVQSVASRYTTYAIPAHSRYSATSRNTCIIRVYLVSTSPALYKIRSFIIVFTRTVAGPYP